MKHTRGRGFGYAKDELNEAQGQEEQKESDTSNVEMKPFDNPIYDSAVINPSDVQPIGYETKPNLEGELSDIPIDTEPTLHTYEPVTEMLKPPIDVDTQKEPYGDVVEPEPKPEKEVTPVLGKYQRLWN